MYATLYNKVQPYIYSVWSTSASPQLGGNEKLHMELTAPDAMKNTLFHLDFSKMFRVDVNRWTQNLRNANREKETLTAGTYRTIFKCSRAIKI